MMSNPWDAELSLSIDEVRDLITSQFPVFSGASIREYGKGWDNTAYLVNKEFVFRLPRREEAVPLMDMEMQILPVLAPQISIQVPYPEFLGKACSNFPWPFSGYRLIQGELACSANLSREERRSWTAPLASFLKKLHRIQLPSSFSLPRDQFNKSVPLVQIDEARVNFKKLYKDGILPETSNWEQLLQEVFESSASREKVLCHGDLYCRHLLLDSDRKLTGVIDWGDMHLGDPACDLSVVFTFLPPECWEEFRSEYGLIHAETWSLARLRAMYATSILMVYSHSINDLNLFNEAYLAYSYLFGIKS